MGISSALGSSALLPAGLGFRNLIINGNFDINQRGATSETADGKFVHDRWILVRGGDGTTTYSTQAFTAGNPIPNYEPTNYARLVTTGQTTSVVYSILTQRIESVRSCAGQQVTISFYAKANSGTPKVSVEVGQSFGSGGSADVNTYLGQVTLSTSWARYTVTGVVPSISGKTIGTSSYLSLFLWVSAGSTYNSRTNSMGIQTNTFDFWGVQLEANYQPTPFEQRPIGIELALCQRYYQRHSTPPFRGGFTNVQSIGRAAMTIPEMRVAPEVVLGGTHEVYDAASTGTVTASQNTYSSKTSIEIDCATATGTFGQYRPALFYDGNGTGYVECKAEL